MTPCPTRGHTTNTEDTTCLEHSKRKKKKTCTKKQSVFRNNHHAIITLHRKKEVSQKSNAVTLTTYSCRTLNIFSATRTCTGFWCPSNEHRRLMQSDGSSAPHKYANHTGEHVQKTIWRANRRRVEDSTLSSSRARQNSNSYALHNWNKNIKVKKSL